MPKRHAKIYKAGEQKKMEKVIEITGCYQRCQFYGESMDGMQCDHPYWADKGAYDNMIITQENSRGGNIPEKCPLRAKSLNIIWKLERR